MNSARYFYMMIQRNDWPELATWLMWQYKVAVNPETLGRTCSQSLLEMQDIINNHELNQWSPGKWRVWLKIRLIECKAFRAGNESTFDGNTRYKVRNAFVQPTVPPINDPEGLIRSLRSDYSGTASKSHYGSVASHVS